MYVFKLCLFQKWKRGRVRHVKYLQIFRRLTCGRGINDWGTLFWLDELWNSGKSKDFGADI